MYSLYKKTRAWIQKPHDPSTRNENSTTPEHQPQTTAWMDEDHSFDMNYLESKADLAIDVDLLQEDHDEINLVMSKIFTSNINSNLHETSDASQLLQDDVYHRLIHDLCDKAHNIEKRFHQYKSETDVKVKELHEEVLKLKKINLNVIKTVTVTASVIGSFFALLAYRHVSDAK